MAIETEAAWSRGRDQPAARGNRRVDRRRHDGARRAGRHGPAGLDVLNSFALKLAGITEDTPEPPGGIIERDASGRLAERLVDNALHLAEHLLSPADLAKRVEGFRRASGD
ncbi:amidohydrolase family protein [Amycolatopsis sp. DSM 110486]|uniref:amidohydrolase family protein n=1 Tax=Amycolatopsis sp. DSM 110486 TaxID=2865832 RepID=UPI001C6A20AE|nr:amidohydrolase family protein [Amycolatopsis sp. DSM 110486]QYN19385.1 amidohydrolase family protein [Amycolatopsis sp. DSM 110486]